MYISIVPTNKGLKEKVGLKAIDITLFKMSNPEINISNCQS